MEIRPATANDLDRIGDIDGTIDSAQYLHVERSGEDLSMSWRLEERPLRKRNIQSNPISDEARFAIRQIVSGADEGVVLIAEHEGLVVGLLAAAPHPPTATMRLIDLRVDFDQRRQGVGLVLLCRLIQEARERNLRAAMAQSRTDNMPAARLLLKAGFELAGLDARFMSNHDLVKEQVSLFWYAPLD